MLIKTKIYQLLLFCSALAIFSCKKQLNTNFDDPNGVGINSVNGSQVFAQALVATVTNNIGSNISTAVDNYDYAQQWMGYWARTTSFSPSGSQLQMETFSLNNSFSDGIWQSLYHNIYDYNFVIANSAPNSILPGASKVMQAMVFQDLVDQFGNVPYTQAANPAITQPKYDSATPIYKALVAKLDSAIVNIQASQSTSDDASDVMFKGNKALWLAFANTIKLRILLRQVPNVYSPTDNYITTELAGVSSTGGFLGAGQDATINPGFKDATQEQNPFWGDYGFQPGTTNGYQNYTFFIANTTMLAFLDSTSDPRLGYFYGKNSAGGYNGNGFGESLTSVTQLSPIGAGILQSASMPALLFSASQSLFMQAEAAQRGMISGSATSLYQQAVEESFRYLAVPNYASAADNFIASSTSSVVNIASSSNPLQTILYQKWVAECELDGLEAYCDYRRTGYPVFAVVSYGVPAGTPMPKRLLYPETEYTQNPVNVDAQNQMATDIYTKIFWGM